MQIFNDKETKHKKNTGTKVFSMNVSEKKWIYKADMNKMKYIRQTFNKNVRFDMQYINLGTRKRSWPGM